MHPAGDEGFLGFGKGNQRELPVILKGPVGCFL